MTTKRTNAALDSRRWRTPKAHRIEADLFVGTGGARVQESPGRQVIEVESGLAIGRLEDFTSRQGRLSLGAGTGQGQ